MKTNTQRLFSLLGVFTLSFCLLLGGSAFAKEKSKEQKLFEKQEKLVENAGPTEWEVYSKAASKLINKETHMEQAKAWLDRSLEIFNAPDNLEVMGDYYAANGDTENALKYYVKAMQEGSRYVTYNATVVQDKINRLRE